LDISPKNADQSRGAISVLGSMPTVIVPRQSRFMLIAKENILQMLIFAQSREKKNEILKVSIKNKIPIGYAQKKIKN